MKNINHLNKIYAVEKPVFCKQVCDTFDIQMCLAAYRHTYIKIQGYDNSRRMADKEFINQTLSYTFCSVNDGCDGEQEATKATI